MIKIVFSILRSVIKLSELPHKCKALCTGRYDLIVVYVIR